jgi:hypothetical protein
MAIDGLQAKMNPQTIHLPKDGSPAIQSENPIKL